MVLILPWIIPGTNRYIVYFILPRAVNMGVCLLLVSCCISLILGRIYDIHAMRQATPFFVELVLVLTFPVGARYLMCDFSISKLLGLTFYNKKEGREGAGGRSWYAMQPSSSLCGLSDQEIGFRINYRT